MPGGQESDQAWSSADRLREAVRAERTVRTGGGSVVTITKPPAATTEREARALTLVAHLPPRVRLMGHEEWHRRVGPGLPSESCVHCVVADRPDLAELAGYIEEERET